MHDYQLDSEPTVVMLCDDGAGLAPFLRHLIYEAGQVASVADTALDGTTTYALVGNAVACSGSTDIEKQVLCDNNGGTITKFIRYAVINSSTGAIASTFDTDFAGVTHAVAGTVEACDDSTNIVPLALCDDNGGTIVKFLRHYVYSGANVVASSFDTDFAGVTYAIAGTVVDCSDVVPSVTPSVTDQATDGTVTTTAGSHSVTVTNMSSTGTVSVDGTPLPAGFTWEAQAPAGMALPAVVVIVAAGGRGIITEIGA